MLTHGYDYKLANMDNHHALAWQHRLPVTRLDTRCLADVNDV